MGLHVFLYGDFYFNLVLFYKSFPKPIFLWTELFLFVFHYILLPDPAHSSTTLLKFPFTNSCFSSTESILDINFGIPYFTYNTFYRRHFTSCMNSPTDPYVLFVVYTVATFSGLDYPSEVGLSYPWDFFGLVQIVFIISHCINFL